ncbi:hypothetical protein AAZX31_03G125900 [Glycine max]
MFKLLMQWLFLLPGFHLLHGNLTTSSSRVMLPKKVLPHLLPLRVAIKERIGVDIVRRVSGKGGGAE